MAINFDAVTDGGASVSSYSHTCTGSKGALVVYVRGALTDDGASVTYNGVSMTQIDKVQIPADRFIYGFLLTNPASGSNTVAITGTVTRSWAASYTGVLQTGQPDAHTTNNGTTVNTLTTSVTTILDNCWLVAFQSAAGGTPSAGTNATERLVSSNSGIFDTNAPQTPAGSKSIQINNSTSTEIGALVISLAPAVSNSGMFLVM